MLVDGPVVLGRVGVPRADVLGLQVLQLAVDVVPLSHLLAVPRPVDPGKMSIMLLTNV